MKKTSKGQDQFPQTMALSVTQSAANTLTFSAGINLGVGLMQSTAIVIHRIVYVLNAAVLAEMKADNDSFTMALCGSDLITDFGLGQPEVYDVFGMHTNNQTAVGFLEQTQFQMHDFTTLPGGGLIVPADRVFLGMDSNGFAAAQTSVAKVYFTIRSLQAAEYLELAQSLRVFR